MRLTLLYDGPYLRILWDFESKIIGVEWKETTSAMTSEEFKTDLMLFATHVEMRKAPSILVDVSKFRYRMQPDVQEWRLRNISPRYSAAGVRRFAFLFPQGAQIPAMMNQSAPTEKFLTRAFVDAEAAERWLTERAMAQDPGGEETRF